VPSCGLSLRRLTPPRLHTSMLLKLSRRRVSCKTLSMATASCMWTAPRCRWKCPWMRATTHRVSARRRSGTGKGLHSYNFRLNVSTFCKIQWMVSVIKRLKLSCEVDEWKPLGTGSKRRCSPRIAPWEAPRTSPWSPASGACCRMAGSAATAKEEDRSRCQWVVTLTPRGARGRRRRRRRQRRRWQKLTLVPISAQPELFLILTD